MEERPWYRREEKAFQKPKSEREATISGNVKDDRMDDTLITG